MFPNKDGLSGEEAEKRLKKYGLNLLPEKSPPSQLSLFITQLKSPLVYVLLFASLVTLAIGHLSDSFIIFLAVFINTILGFIQEKRASDALYALKSYIADKTTVIRDGKRVVIDTPTIVVGDLVVLNQGVKVPADGELIFANRLYFDESIITGEGTPVLKEKNGEAFMGATVSVGQGIMKVEKTGIATKIGRIAEQVQKTDEDTPLQKQLKSFSKKLVVVIVVLTTLVFIIGLVRGENLVEIFTTSVALAVSSIPEGLLVSLTVILAIGMQKILRRRGLVRELSSAETLGGVTTICVDKTGTLTQGKMEMTDYVGDKEALAKQALLANDLDDPLVIAAFEWGRTIIKDYIQEHPRLDSIPFSSKERYFMSLHKWSGNDNIIFINGAPDLLLERCILSENKKVEIENTIDDLAGQGKRLIGLAKKMVSHRKKILVEADAKSDLEWVGLLAFSDPVRLGVSEALGQAKEAGIKVMVITGDYTNTSEFVLSEIGMPVTKEEIITGGQLEKMAKEELARKVKVIRLFARTTPDQKLKIVEALKANGEVVAMMGDGVNDAPALHKADIGIVVEEATDVAKESADLVLLDSNFATIIAAIEEGRGIFDNIRKIILYLMSDAFGEIIVVIGGILLGLPLPITAVQILWINLISDGFPNLALTIDPKRSGIMKEKPRLSKEPLVSLWMILLIGIISLTSGLVALLFFHYIYSSSSDITLARSAAFATLGLNSLVYVFAVRTLTVPFWKNNLFENQWLILAVILGFSLQILPFATPTFREFFGIEYLSMNYWFMAICFSLLMFVFVELFKLVYGLNAAQILLRQTKSK
ncbi:MAG: Calcium-translocating P-type ATPase, PMCA-type [Candidatus Woesebacteria bacterium GW2011_GWA1_39_21]|uniref:Calcium-translocating P-type ATPase, PMCA-type n=1 Tax=Candidatus Woesebacteria bacterium GW2011_GWA1_39_21 TaxID=1618550 RepID=A0A0G0NGH3_9BACT|nr:MAG: Calcium-translocating P-type ATPase, PMCA-type [Candidatus Woesebacteria bacterium GW2011_GWA1_39_21]